MDGELLCLSLIIIKLVETYLIGAFFYQRFCSWLEGEPIFFDAEEEL